jgi:hypothetical protein
MFFVYSSHRSYDAAYAAIEMYYASGEISECDDPRITRDGDRWLVELRDNLYSC